MRRYLEEIIIALSLTNLLFVTGWRRILYYNADYLVKSPPNNFDYIGVILTLFFTAGIFLGGLWLARYLLKGKTPKIAKWIFLTTVSAAFLLTGIVLIKTEFWIVELIGRKIVLIGAVILLPIGIIILIRNHLSLVKFARALMLVFSPLALVTLSLSVTGLMGSKAAVQQEDDSFYSAARQNSSKPNIKSRVVWIIFDEFGYQAPFELRPADLEMPEFDRLRQQSIFASQAMSPAPETMRSLPSLIIGRKVKEAKLAGNSELLLDFSDGQEQSKFSEIQTVFSEVKQMGGDSAIIGWHHPYCRVIGKDLSTCHWEPSDIWNDSHSESLSQAIGGSFKRIFNAMPFEYRSQFSLDTDYIDRYNRLLTGTKEVVADSNIDLTLLHLPLPHYPNRYNRFKQDFSGGEGYVDNLALTDHLLGEIRQTMEKADLWDNTIVIISSDHHWRVKEMSYLLTKKDFEIVKEAEDFRVPFIVKLKNHNEPIEYSKPFNTVITRDLILALMRGEISSSQETKEWLDSHAVN